MRCIMTLQQNFDLAISLKCLPTLSWKLVGKVVLFIFRQKPPCSTRVDVLETGDVPILFSFPQMKNLGMTVELNSKRDKIICPAFGLYSSPAEDSAMGRIVLDLSSLTYHPKSRERSVHPTKHVMLALS